MRVTKEDAIPVGIGTALGMLTLAVFGLIGWLVLMAALILLVLIFSFAG